MRKMHATRKDDTNTGAGYKYDPWLLVVALSLLATGMVMVASASITLAERVFDTPFYYFQRQLYAVLVGVVCGGFILKIPLSLWEKFSTHLLFLAFVLLILVLIPGIGREVNGSVRWIRLGPVNFQCSEPAKIFIITYMAAYLVRHAEQLNLTFTGFIRPVGIVTLISGLLLLEPDYGSVIIIFLTTLGMLFMAGIPLRRFFVWIPVVVFALGALAVFPSYRLERLKAFIDPWQDPFNSGYQLIQSLIAFGRGEWFGVGLGSSVQKLFYLTQAHTDFIFAISAEELGLVFTLLVILMFFFIVRRAFTIARTAYESGYDFAAFMAYGIGLVLGIQAFIHMGVNVGLLPTKGLTLPLFSYGSSSIVTSCALIAILLRIDFENRHPFGLEVPAPPTDWKSGLQTPFQQELPWNSSTR